MACQRSTDRGEDDEWTLLTRANLAFDAGEPESAMSLAPAVEREDLPHWHLETAVADFERSVALLPAVDGARMGDALQVFANLRDAVERPAGEE